MPGMVSSGNITPASTTMILLPYSSTVMFLPISPTPPSGMMRSFGLATLPPSRYASLMSLRSAARHVGGGQDGQPATDNSEQTELFRRLILSVCRLVCGGGCAGKRSLDELGQLVHVVDQRLPQLVLM